MKLTITFFTALLLAPLAVLDAAQSLPICSSNYLL
jgi:hypothetical protein